MKKVTLFFVKIMKEITLFLLGHHFTIALFVMVCLGSAVSFLFSIKTGCVVAVISVFVADFLLIRCLRALTRRFCRESSMDEISVFKDEISELSKRKSFTFADAKMLETFVSDLMEAKQSTVNLPQPAASAVAA